MRRFTHGGGLMEPVIDRGEAVGLLFTVTDILETLRRIELLLRDDGETEETDEE
jgi:hypothetical protein